MIWQTIQDTILLFALGSCGWFIFRAIRFPTPAFMGTIMVIGALRMARFDLPAGPAYLAPLVQLLLGLYIGAKINRNTVRQLKCLPLPAGIIIAWSIAVVFLLGKILTVVSGLDVYTAMLSSSMGGLAEMAILALSTNAKMEIIIIVQLARVVLTLMIFPVLLTLWVPKGTAGGGCVAAGGEKKAVKVTPANNISPSLLVGRVKDIFRQAGRRGFAIYLGWLLFSLAVAAGGGLLLSALGVPAGVMVGAMLSTAVASLGGARIIAPGNGFISFMLIGAGITIADSITPDTLTALLSGRLPLVIAVSTLVIFLTSLVVAYFMSKLTGWDYATSFLAAAPAGFTVMALLADKYEKDAFSVSILHLCRLISLKLFLPLFFLFFDNL